MSNFQNSPGNITKIFIFYIMFLIILIPIMIEFSVSFLSGSSVALILSLFLGELDNINGKLKSNKKN